MGVRWACPIAAAAAACELAASYILYGNPAERKEIEMHLGLNSRDYETRNKAK